VSNQSDILVGSTKGTVWIKVEGRGNFENSPNIKELAKTMISKGSSSFILDLEQCELMDSTFLGTLASVAFNLREVEGGELRVINANERNFTLLESLGLDHLFNIEADANQEVPQHLMQTPATGGMKIEDQREVILTAHEALVEADPRNEFRFRDVIDFLRNEISESEG
jgi:anti-sigma B factor antagonist